MSSNVPSTTNERYNVTNPFLMTKNTRESGEGKGPNDSNGANSQPVLNEHLNKAGGSVRDSGDVHSALDGNRARGDLNATGSFGGESKPEFKINPIKWFQDLKFHKYEGTTMRLHEFFSQSASDEAGELRGLGPGWLQTEAMLVERGISKLDVPKCTLRRSTDVDFKSGSATSNPKGLLSHTQKKADAAAKGAQKAEAQVKRERMNDEEAARVSALYSDDLVGCDVCAAEFASEALLRRHTSRGCAPRRLRAAATRRRLHTESVESRLEAMDAAELLEVERRSVARSDCFTVNFPALSVDVGWALHEILQGGVDTAPLSLGGLDWSAAESASDVRIGARIRIDAWRFEKEARECFGADWRTGYFYGKVTKKNGQRVWASYDEDDSDDDDTASHFSFLELGVQSGAVASNSITPFATVVGPFL